MLGSAVPAMAAGEELPISGEVSIEVHDDWTTRSDNPDDERNDAYVEIETALEAAITDAFSAKTLLVLEPVRDPDPGADRFFFEAHGLFAEELFGEYAAGGRFAVRAGTRSGERRVGTGGVRTV